ncbi:glycosyltransferase family 2 protein [Aridibaculum aurantiacum]|uniref:glycosyltransferase family 2 protein n=1 Tax=Aridibaculum aurantiacum TaxID=2810307 RepID=UPI001A97BC75|nr:glycosyltransferase family 2 protein [Aridibaculum aurantiacum]
MKPTLTIAIPTYNRLDKVKRALSKLQSQIGDNVCVKIFDNASAPPVAENVKGFDSLEIFTSSVNVGLSGNFLRCFEYCETDWLWILSDDDIPLDNAVEIILDTIQANNKAVFINFFSELSRSEPFPNRYETCVGISQLVSSLRSFSNLLLISTSIYKASELKSSIKAGYYFSTTIAPHLAILFDYLTGNENAEIVYSNNSIVHYQAPTTGSHWNIVNLNKGVSDLVLQIRNESDRRNLFKKIQEVHPYYHLPPKEVVRYVVNSREANIHLVVSDFLRDHTFLYWANGGSTFKFLFFIMSNVVLLQLLQLKVIRNILRKLMRNKNIHRIPIYNRYEALKTDLRL